MSIIKTLLTKIEIHPTCYLFLFLAIITGSFHAVFFCASLLFLHECGHFFTACLLHWKTDKISFYPFGGVSKFSTFINCPIHEELLVLLMGPLVQCLAFSCLGFAPFTTYQKELLTMIHYNILIFNLLPIYPLDGGRIFQVFSCYFVSYKMSYHFALGLSYICLLFLIFCFFRFPSFNLVLLFILLCYRLLEEKKNIKYYRERFLLERYLKHYPHRKTKIVKSDKDFQRECYHFVKQGKWYQREEDYLENKYQKKEDGM